VVVVNYRSWDDTNRLIGQLRESPGLRRAAAEIVVVDNHSPLHPVAPRLRRLGGVSLRRWGRNRGFARAVNEGCRLSRGDWFLLLNPDVSLGQQFLAEVLALAERLTEESSETGVVGFRLQDPGGAHQLSTGPFPTLAGTLSRLLLPRHRRKYRIAPEGGGTVDWATGCCLLVRRRCWEDLGGLDPDFFLYYEDVDFCRRARAAGWSVRYEPALSVVHHRPLHARPVPPHLRLITRHALLTYARKHWPDWQVKILAGVIRLESWWRRTVARRRGDAVAAGVFRQLGRLAADLGRGDPGAASRRLRRAVRREEHDHDGAAVHCHPLS
jgi:GT2 family glycosyltransferase